MIHADVKRDKPMSPESKSHDALETMVALVQPAALCMCEGENLHVDAGYCGRLLRAR